MLALRHDGHVSQSVGERMSEQPKCTATNPGLEAECSLAAGHYEPAETLPDCRSPHVTKCGGARWVDSAPGATPHRDPEKTKDSLGELCRKLDETGVTLKLDPVKLDAIINTPAQAAPVPSPEAWQAALPVVQALRIGLSDASKSTIKAQHEIARALDAFAKQAVEAASCAHCTKPVPIEPSIVFRCNAKAMGQTCLKVENHSGLHIGAEHRSGWMDHRSTTPHDPTKRIAWDSMQQYAEAMLHYTSDSTSTRHHGRKMMPKRKNRTAALAEVDRQKAPNRVQETKLQDMKRAVQEKNAGLTQAYAEQDAAQARVKELEAALNACANLAHLAWNSAATIRPAFERIEEVARAALAKK